MTTCKRVNKPLEEGFSGLYVRKLDDRVIKKITRIAEKEDMPKWVVVQSLLASSLGVKTKKKLDLSKYLKKV